MAVRLMDGGEAAFPVLDGPDTIAGLFSQYRPRIALYLASNTIHFISFHFIFPLLLRSHVVSI